jgi:hypothetical protein
MTGATRSSEVSESLEAGEPTGHQHERKPALRAPIPADLQPPPATQPRQRPFHPPAMPPQQVEDSIPRRRSQARLAALS